ncbi:ArsR/SmtB family transcription factor [Egicoccus sp. AB-alg6-2]|uniref:ArsR/SmtB family transcription factor n=1 Tax=Egicoccus sp. AB-alg6-2 TaxID=3242692 RepID=UPI00359EB543
MQRREATPDEVRALASPLRLRILRLCNRQARTNRELADALEKDPGTVLHHVKRLVATGFLVPEQVRKGASGALEKPYRSTGLSWQLDFPTEQGTTPWYDAGLEAFRDELYAAGPQALRGGARFDLYLNQASAQEFNDRLMALVEEFIAREDPDGDWHGGFYGLHVMPGDAGPRTPGASDGADRTGRSATAAT